MARIKSVMSVNEMVKGAVARYVTDSTQTYPNFLDTAPVFVTYYSRSMYKSTHDVSLEAFNEVVGDESPNRFHKIEGLPIYSLDTSELGTDITDYGLIGDVNSSCVILPNTVSPKAEDMLVIELHSTKFLFTVTSSSPDNFNNNKFYKLSIKLVPFTVAEIERQVDEEFAVDYESIGKSAKVVLPKSYSAYAILIRDLYDDLLASYQAEYYDRLSGVFADGTLGIADQYLNKFMNTNQLAEPYRQYRNSCNITPSLDKHVTRKEYAASVFASIEDLKVPDFSIAPLISISPKDVNNARYTLNYFRKSKIRFVTHTPSVSIGLNGFSIYAVLNFAAINDAGVFASLSDTNTAFVMEFLRYLHKKQTGPSSVPSDTEVIETLLAKVSTLDEKFSSLPDLDDTLPPYYLQPLVLFVLKHLHSYLTNA